jgi:soluble lytic murein transglycosylase
MAHSFQTRITQMADHRYGIVASLLSLMLVTGSPAIAQNSEREQFVAAWAAASRGDHTVFSSLPRSLTQYELFPYLEYEDLRHRRGQISPAIIAAFIEQHEDWAFASGLRLTWLKTLGKQGRWRELLQYAGNPANTQVRCQRARALIETGQVGDLLKEAQSLWTVGKSQPPECDPVFAWLKDNGGITPSLAWERIRLAIRAGNPRFTFYLARFIPPKDRVWLNRWQDLNRKGYRNLGQSRDWPDQELSRMITSVSLQRLARHDAKRAWQTFKQLDGHFGWSTDTRGGIIREIALQSAVALDEDTLEVMEALPLSHRDDQVLQWWVRMALVAGEWETLITVIEQMPAESRSDGRWRYWQATANEKLGNTDRALQLREQLSLESSYYGFLAADRLDRPYSICPLARSRTG